MPFIKPISIDRYPAIKNCCFGFAVGDIEHLDSKKSEEKFNMNPAFPIEEAFLRKLQELGYENLPRQINSLDEAHSDEFVFMVFDFTPLKVRIPFMDEPVIYWDYHVIRRELDGSWVHKPGWKDAPCEIQTTDWEPIFNEFGRKYVLFALAV